ncbi:uncharacterized protein C11orf16 homolog isoform X1 [Cavia porcellus]|uniref:uncharacterized protein C11orf16 homolog isoform X1 n=1 Tax=Cavia porcellus TaxID=10141 RepID=UPI00022B2553|nr:uncharacterized protein C11orf16 homolog isoform X3 [Cavia porcellus]
MPLPKYCSVATTLQAPSWGCVTGSGDLSLACPFAHGEPRLPSADDLTRYASHHPCLCIADPAWQGPGWLGGVRDAANTWVLARREPDGLYYQAQIKAAPELERQGILLVEFVTGPKLPAQRQSVVSDKDVVQLSPYLEYSLQPGDKVLAAWEPDRQRYGPGTVLLGSEVRDNQRAGKEEEVTVHLWNGETAQVPLGGVRWVPPTIWKKAVERLSKPYTREYPSAPLWAPCCSSLGTLPGGITNRLPPDAALLCPPCHSHTCCQLPCWVYLCCCPSMSSTWWPLTGTSHSAARDLPETGLKPAAQPVPLEDPKAEAVAVHAPHIVSSFSSSSSSSCEDLEDNLEMGLPQRLVVNSAVNTDPILPKRPLIRNSPRQPPWRYWRRNGLEPHPAKPGICHNIPKDDDKQEKVQAAVAGTTKELALKATNMKSLQTLQGGHRKLFPGITVHQWRKSSLNTKSPQDLGKAEKGLLRDSYMVLRPSGGHMPFANAKAHGLIFPKLAHAHSFTFSKIQKIHEVHRRLGGCKDPRLNDY